MNQEEKILKWREIIDTANNEDPQYSFRLFSELLDDAKQKDNVKAEETAEINKLDALLGDKE